MAFDPLAVDYLAFDASTAYTRTDSVTVTVTPSFSRSLALVRDVVVTVTASYVRGPITLLRALAVTVTTTPTVVRQVAKTLSVAITATPSFSRQIAKTIALTVSVAIELFISVGAEQSVYAKSLVNRAYTRSLTAFIVAKRIIRS